MQFEEWSSVLKVVRLSAVLTSLGRSFHHRGARPGSVRDWEVEVKRGKGARHPGVAEQRGLAGKSAGAVT